MIGCAFHSAIRFVLYLQHRAGLVNLPGGLTYDRYIIFERYYVYNTGHCSAALASTDLIFVPNEGGRWIMACSMPSR